MGCKYGVYRRFAGFYGRCCPKIEAASFPQINVLSAPCKNVPWVFFYTAETGESLPQVQAQLYGSESWTVRKKERKKIDAFELWTWRRILRVSWTEKRTNLSVLEDVKPKRSLEATVLRLMFVVLVTS
jgi:hypothetical protein